MYPFSPLTSNVCEANRLPRSFHASCKIHELHTYEVYLRSHKKYSTMGRSQVERNRTKGRPGNKGRGRGGRGGRGGGRGAPTRGPTKKQQQNNLGSNSWRYEETNATETTTSLDDDSLLMDFENLYYEYDNGPIQESIEERFLNGNPLGDDSEVKEEYTTSNFDIRMFAKCLNTLSSADWMWIDNPRLLEEYNSRYVNSVKPKKMTVAKMRLGGHDLDYNKNKHSCRRKRKKSRGESAVGSI